MTNQINCEKCHSPIGAQNLNIKMGIAKCDQCGHSFYPSQRRRFEKPKQGETRGITTERSGMEFILTRKWFSSKTFFLIFFTIAWNTFLVFWYTMAFSDDNAPLMMKLFPIVHVAVGLGLFYGTLCSIFNKTIFTVTYQNLSVKHGPIPYRGNCEISRRDVEQLWIKEVVRHHKNSTQTWYDLFLKRRNEKDLKIGKFHHYDQALKVEQEIESALGIQDKSVAGEKLTSG
ncbi:hypothetical protein N9N67_05065 [Bacteriovoracaceae bacterium]|nr:hypothetical protein [Bacteriovoracaceae bacterium]